LLQSALIAGGAVIGLCHALRTEADSEQGIDATDLRGVIARLEALEHAPFRNISREQGGAAAHSGAQVSPGENLPDRVSRDRIGASENVNQLELADAMDRVSGNLRREMDARFVAQDKAIESLREMTAHTSEMIGRLLDRLDGESELPGDAADAFGDSFSSKPAESMAAGFRG
jgi:hypothetical protein